MLTTYTHTHMQKLLCDVMEVLTNIIVVISQYTCVSKQHITYLKLTMLWVISISIKLKGENKWKDCVPFRQSSVSPKWVFKKTRMQGEQTGLPPQKCPGMRSGAHGKQFSLFSPAQDRTGACLERLSIVKVSGEPATPPPSTRQGWVSPLIKSLLCSMCIWIIRVPKLKT